MLFTNNVDGEEQQMVWSEALWMEWAEEMIWRNKAIARDLFVLDESNKWLITEAY